jgi:ketosteroid isomerase-like protein
VVTAPNPGYGVRVAADPAAVVGRFNESINRRDLHGLADLMTDDHRFVDTGAAAVAGKQACLDAWRGFFELFPDYRNVFTSLAVREDVVVVVGYSECAEPDLAGPAIWTATIRGGAVAEWRVYADTPEVRAALDLPEAG